MEQNPEQFRSLISFGEVLDPASKAAILGLDSHVQMWGMVNNELHVSRRAKTEREREREREREATKKAFLRETE